MKTNKLALALVLAFLASGTAYARPDAVPGAACTTCHKAMPPTKTNLSPVATAMFATHKDIAKCKECHTKGTSDKLASKTPGK
jgi:hypothetical protein